METKKSVERPTYEISEFKTTIESDSEENSFELVDLDMIGEPLENSTIDEAAKYEPTTVLSED